MVTEKDYASPLGYDLPVCPLCRGPHSLPFVQCDDKDYFRCQTCEVTFLDPSQRPAPDEELAHYQWHENDPADAGYRAFLSRLSDPLLAKLSDGMEGLDYGSGPGPALAAMLEECGMRMRLYDPFFAADADALTRTYDFITCTETVEHFHHPAQEFERLDRLLRPGGWIGLMTTFQTDDDRFANWHYRKDPTHVIFYRESTFAFLAGTFGWHLEVPRKDVVLLQKPALAIA